MRKIGYIDMDDVKADFRLWFRERDLPIIDPVPEMYEVGFFRNLKPTKGAITAVEHIQGICEHFGYDLHILTQPVMNSPHSYSEKVEWVREHFPNLIGKIHMTQDKSLFARKGTFLIDDNEKKWRDGFVLNGGTFIHFDYELYINKPADAWKNVFNALYIHCRAHT